MSSRILLHNTMRGHDGQWNELCQALRDAVDFTQHHTPQLAVEIFIEEERHIAHSFQWFPDSEAVRAHWNISASAIDRVMDHGSVERLDVYGNPDQQVLDTLETFSQHLPVTVSPRLAGFLRW